MEFRERVLVHQIHPIKLVADWGTGVAAMVPLWRHSLVIGLLVGLVPPLVASALLLRYGDLEPYQASRLGQYAAAHMPRPMELVRLAGVTLMGVAAWHRVPWLIAAGLAVLVPA